MQGEKQRQYCARSENFDIFFAKFLTVSGKKLFLEGKFLISNLIPNLIPNFR